MARMRYLWNAEECTRERAREQPSVPVVVEAGLGVCFRFWKQYGSWRKYYKQ